MDQVLGMIYGIALRDALGAPVEFWELKGIRERHGPAGILAGRLAEKKRSLVEPPGRVI